MSLDTAGRQLPAQRGNPDRAETEGTTPYLCQNFCYKNSSGHQDTNPAPRYEQAGLAQ